MNAQEQSAKAAAFRAMHRGPKLLVLPNAWDCLSARIFEREGFPAIATTSGGIAAVFGYPDGQKISAREMLQMAGRIAETVSVPVTADLESGYGTTTEQIAETMRDAMSRGIVGANFEDGRGPNQPLADVAFQVEAIRAIRAAAKSNGMDFVLNARVDVFLYDSGDDASRFKEAIRRAQAYRDAGADCIFLMRLTDREIIRRIVPEIGCPVNIMAGHGAPGIAELEQLGVARVTFGTGPIRATLPLIREMAETLRAGNEFYALEQTEFTHAAVNTLFANRGC